MNIITLLDMARSCFPDRAALTSQGQHYTYEDLFTLSSQAATKIQDSESDTISLLDIASPALPIALFGSAWAGKPFAPLNYRLSVDDLTQQLNRISPALVLCGDDYREQIPCQGTPSKIPSTSTPESANTTASSHEWTQLPASSQDTSSHDTGPQEPKWQDDPDKVAVLLFTSGTTGGAKIAMLRHRHLASYVIGSVEFMSAGGEEAILTAVPPYHIAAVANLLSNIYAGRRIVQLPNFDADSWIDLAIQENITHAMVVPTMLARIADRLEVRGEALPKLMSVSYGGGKTSRSVVEKILKLLPHTDFVNAYGLTETSSTVAVLGPAEHREIMDSDNPAIQARLGSVGLPLPGLEVSIRDKSGTEVAPGVGGEIWIRGEQVSGEYQDRENQLTPDGWFCTNDGGHFDTEGYLYVEGRLDDVIIRGGENISPGEIEDVLLKHESIADAAVVGVPDRDWGELIVAVVVTRDGFALTEEEIIEHVKENLRSLKSPDKVAFKTELPYNATGKLLRKDLKAELQEELPQTN